MLLDVKLHPPCLATGPGSAEGRRPRSGCRRTAMWVTAMPSSRAGSTSAATRANIQAARERIRTVKQQRLRLSRRYILSIRTLLKLTLGGAAMDLPGANYL